MIIIFVELFREATERAQAESLAREEELRQTVSELDTAKKEVEESLEIHLEEASQQVTCSSALYYVVHILYICTVLLTACMHMYMYMCIHCNCILYTVHVQRILMSCTWYMYYILYAYYYVCTDVHV